MHASTANGFDIGQGNFDTIRLIGATMGASMTDPAYPTTAHDYSGDAEELAQLEEAMSGGPRGAVAVSGIAVGLLLLAWLSIYLFVFLPRGTVG